MSLTKKYAKSMGKSKLNFPVEMYNNVYGSLAICGYIFSLVKNKYALIKKWQEARKNPKKIDWSLKDSDFIKRTMDFFNLALPDNFPVAFVVGKYNSLFAPYVDGQLLPLREDGIMGTTLRTGLAYPIDFQEEMRK